MQGADYANIDIYACSRHQIKKAAAHAAAKAGTNRRLHVQPPNVGSAAARATADLVSDRRLHV